MRSLKKLIKDHFIELAWESFNMLPIIWVAVSFLILFAGTFFISYFTFMRPDGHKLLGTIMSILWLAANLGFHALVIYFMLPYRNYKVAVESARDYADEHPQYAETLNVLIDMAIETEEPTQINKWFELNKIFEAKKAEVEKMGGEFRHLNDLAERQEKELNKLETQAKELRVNLPPFFGQ